MFTPELLSDAELQDVIAKANEHLQLRRRNAERHAEFQVKIDALNQKYAEFQKKLETLEICEEFSGLNLKLKWKMRVNMHVDHDSLESLSTYGSEFHAGLTIEIDDPYLQKIFDANHIAIFAKGRPAACEELNKEFYQLAVEGSEINSSLQSAGFRFRDFRN